MKKICFLILCFILFSFNAHAFGPFVGVGAGTPAAGCNPATEYVGSNSEGASTLTSAVDVVRISKWTPTCSGPLNTAYIAHYGTGNDNVKVLIFLDDGDDSPDSGDTLIAYTGVIVSGATDGWKSGALSSNPEVSVGNDYWVGFVSDATSWPYKLNYTGGPGQKVQTISGAYSDPATNVPTLTGSWATNANYNMSVYSSIGE